MAVRAEILIVDAEHPDEIPAGEPCDALHELFVKHPVPGVDSILGNTDAYEQGRGPDGMYRRKADENLVTAEPIPDGNREQRRKYELVTRIFPRYQLVIARHGIRQPDADYAFCHPAARSLVWDAIALLGLSRVSYPHAPSHASYLSNYLGLDLSPNSPHTAESLYEAIVRLALGEKRPLQPLSHYAAVGDITQAAANQYGLPKEVVPFTPLSERIVQGLNWPLGTVAVTGSSILYAHTGFFGQAAVPL